jgi:hypothetical protein
MGGFVSVQARGNVALVRLDRPPANAMDQALLDEATGVPPISRRVAYLAPVGDARLPGVLPV